jgi:hypothetical protein
LLATLRNAGGEAMPANVAVKPLYVYDVTVESATEGAEVWAICLSVIPFAAIVVTGVIVTVRRKYR